MCTTHTNTTTHDKQGRRYSAQYNTTTHRSNILQQHTATTHSINTHTHSHDKLGGRYCLWVLCRCMQRRGRPLCVCVCLEIIWSDSCALRLYEVTQIESWRDSFIRMIWLNIYIHGMYVTWHIYASEKSVERSLRLYDVTSLYKCVIWLIYVYDMTHLYTFIYTTCTWQDSCVWARNQWREPFDCIMWLIRMWDMTHTYVWYDSSIYMAYMWQDSRVPARIQRRDPLDSIMWLIHMCDTTRSCVWYDSF